MAAEVRSALVLTGDSCDTEVLGGKGAALDRLVHHVPVPASGVVTTDAYRAFVAHPELGVLVERVARGDEVAADDVDTAFLAVEMPDDLVHPITSLARTVGAGSPLAVRSSATVEDLAESSFAGQFRSLLHIDSDDEAAVLEAVRLVFASLWHPVPCAYRRAFGIAADDAAMAVVLMRMVPAVRAGVVFTVDPSGAAGSARVEAVEGLGESLVSGRRTPEVWVHSREDPDGDLPQDVSEALRLALDIESLTGAPQDVEWAWDGDQLWVVQARPITATSDEGDGFDSDPGDHDLTVAGIAEMLPGVLPPLLWELDSHLVDESFRGVLDDLGVLPADVGQSHLVRRVRGRAALDFSRLQGMALALPGSAAGQLEEQYFGSRRPGRPAAPSRSRGSRLTSLRHDYRVLRARRRNALEGQIAIEAVADLCRDPVALPEADTEWILTYRLALVDLALRTAGAELGVAADAVAAYRRIELLLLAHLGAEAAGRAAEDVTAGRGIAVTPELDASAAVFGGPTWDELGLQPPAIGDRGSGGDALASLESELGRCPTWGTHTLRSAIRTRALRNTVAEAVVQLCRRERLKAALLRLGGEVRRVHLELGHRLVATGAIGAAIEVELLTTPELMSALRGDPLSAGELGRRRRWRIRYEAEPPLPARFRGRPEPAELELPPGGRLDGWAASGGRSTGRAQVVTCPTGPLRPGAILVAQATDATWSPLFLDAGAIVLELGGPLSHAAILARELGVPAVLNVAGATQYLDGCEVTVDGDAGVVVVHDETEAVS